MDISDLPLYLSIPSIFVLAFLVIFILGFISYEITFNITENNIIKIYRETRLVFEGKKAFVNIESGGMTTTVTIYKKLFPFKVIYKVYSDNNIIIES